MRLSSSFPVVLAILRKDVRTEVRTRQMISSMFVFAVLVLWSSTSPSSSTRYAPSSSVRESYGLPSCSRRRSGSTGASPSRERTGVSRA
jgi:hypothetical protein